MRTNGLGRGFVLAGAAGSSLQKNSFVQNLDTAFLIRGNEFLGASNAPFVLGFKGFCVRGEFQAWVRPKSGR